jgi:hypothetical protein
MNANPDPEQRAAAAYEWAANLIGLARRLIADGVDVDVSPIRPAIQELCDLIKQLPPAQANEWVVHLLDLQHELAALGRDFSVREPDNGVSGPQGEGPGACR